MRYRPRPDCSDVPLDSDDRWLDRVSLQERVDGILLGHENETAGFAEVPFSLTSAELDLRIEALRSRLRELGRMQETDRGQVFHWSVAELLAHRALADFWSAVTDWPLGVWPWDSGKTFIGPTD